MAEMSRENLKREILLRISKQFIAKSSNLNHTQGTTQTTTNILDRKFQTGEEEIDRTTRFIHQKQVSLQAMKIVSATSQSENDYEQILANYAGLFHDIGHCTYGHDGEAKINDFTQSFTASLTESRRKEIKEFRNKYFSAGENGYESQQDWQNELIGQQEKGNTFIFDHGEESALAIINICESVVNDSRFDGLRRQEGFLEVYNEVKQDLTQCALMHSRPAFNKAGHASEAVAIADSVAFIQDDLEQALLAKRLDNQKAHDHCTEYYNKNGQNIESALADELQGETLQSKFGIGEVDFTKFLSLTPTERKELVTQEIVSVKEAAEKDGVTNPPLQNGKHLDDLMWYAGKINKSRADYVENMVDLLKRGGYREGAKDEWSMLCKKAIDNMQAPGAKPETIQAKVKALLELKYKVSFPVNYQCYVINNAVISNDLIYGKNLGNNTTKDGASTKFMLLSLYKGYIKGFGNPPTYDEDQKITIGNKKSKTGEQEVSKCEAATLRCTFKDFFEKMRVTPEFKKLKQIIMSEHEFSGLTTGGVPAYMNQSQSDMEVFKRLGFHVDERSSSQGILDQYSPVQLISKMVEGMTNEFSRTYTRYLQKDMTIEQFHDMGMLDISGVDAEKAKPDGRHLTPQDLLGLGFTAEQIKDFSDTLGRNNQKFTQEDVWGKKVDAIEHGISKFDEDIKKQIQSLGTEIDDPGFKKAQIAYTEIAELLESENLSPDSRRKVLTLRHKLCVNISKKIDAQNKTVEFDEKEGVKAVEAAPDQSAPVDYNAIIGKINVEEVANDPQKLLDAVYDYVDKENLSADQISEIYKKLSSAVKELEEKNKTAVSGKQSEQELQAAVSSK